LIKGGSTIELLAGIKTVVFDKTGTLTTGNFKIKNINCIEGDELSIKRLLFSLEKHSSHPIARSLQSELADFSSGDFKWKQIAEDKGIGINATDENGVLYSAGSFQMVKHFHPDLSHDIYLLKNNKLIATIDLEDEVKADAASIIKELTNKGMRVILLSGDRKINCERVASKTGIREIYYEKLPSQKLTILESLVKENPTAMIGDGVNDAPALAKATVGISISNATQTAIQSAQVILLDKSGLEVLLKAMRISQLTYSTIKQNLFWAFFYNVIAIPIAAAGYLNPMIGALSMAFSDVVVIGNSLRLRTRKID
jgi:Cu+-exporting ATPase